MLFVRQPKLSECLAHGTVLDTAHSIVPLSDGDLTDCPMEGGFSEGDLGPEIPTGKNT